MKKILVIFLCVLMCVSFSSMALAANSRDISLETSLALQLKELGLFQGVAENDDGTTNFDLLREPNRVEALIMLVRTLGKGGEAEAYPKTHPFSDVPAWADGYVSYAYDNRLTNGVSDTLFGTESTASAEMYLTFMLRALGYSDGDSGEFTWDAPWALAAWCGILPTQVDRTNFLRADVVDVTCAALFAYIKGTQTMLYERLMSEDGAFTQIQFNTAFTDDPFADFRLIDDQISDAIAAYETLGMLGDNIYATECHIITDMVEDDGVLIVSALVCYGNSTLNEDNTVGNYRGKIDLRLIELDARTLKCQSCRTAEELIAEGLSMEECFSKETLADLDSLSTGMTGVYRMKTQMQIDSGLIGYKQPIYEEALAKVTASLSWVTQTLETDPCTILLGWLGGVPHGSCAYLYLIYKPGSAVGEGETVSLPMPRENGWGITSEPNNLWLSEDGLTLYYLYHYPQRLVIDEGLLSERVVHEAGTYSYTVDLNTGVTSLSILHD
jgi:hypothetical protein